MAASSTNCSPAKVPKVRHRHLLQTRAATIKGEETGEGLTENLRQYDIYRKMLADYFNEPEDKAMYRIEEFERRLRRNLSKSRDRCGS